MSNTLEAMLCVVNNLGRSAAHAVKTPPTHTVNHAVHTNHPPTQRWIVYQLLLALQQCHSVGVCHGDIKAENVVVTSWNWVYLTDFACYKPLTLPIDNPVRA